MTPQTPRLGHLSPRPERRDGDPAAATAWITGLLHVLGAVHGHGKWQCPAHDGNSPALALRAGDRGAVLYCHAGCDTADVLATLGLRRGHLFRPPDAPPALWARARCSHITLPPMTVTSSPQAAGYRHECFHDYGDRYRKERLRRPTTGEKMIRWEARHPTGGEWIPGLLGTKEAELPLYRERDLTLAIGAGEPILLVESESSVDALVGAGIYATTWAGGASSPPIDTLRHVLGDYDRVVFVADADKAGRDCARNLSRLGIVDRVLPGDVDGGAAGDDARDLLQRLGAAGLLALVTAALAAEPGAPPDTGADRSLTPIRSEGSTRDTPLGREADVSQTDIRSDSVDDVETWVRAEVLPVLPAGSAVAYEPERDHLHLYRPDRDQTPVRSGAPEPAADLCSLCTRPVTAADLRSTEVVDGQHIDCLIDPRINTALQPAPAEPAWLRTVARGSPGA